jgi:hypothetical protein
MAFRIILIVLAAIFQQILGFSPILLDLDEINLVQYEIKIGNQPIVLDNNDLKSTNPVRKYTFVYIFRCKKFSQKAKLHIKNSDDF